MRTGVAMIGLSLAFAGGCVWQGFGFALFATGVTIVLVALGDKDESILGNF